VTKRSAGGQTARSPPLAVAILIETPVLADRIAAMLADQTEIVVDDLDAAVIITDTLPESQDRRPVIVLVDDVDLAAAFRDGATGVLPTTATSEQLRAAVVAVAQGLSVMAGGALADAVDRETSGDDSQVRPAPATPLSPRELEVLNLMAAGASNKVIARTLDISIHTAKFHVASILAKLDATGRTDAVAQAARLGLLML
jgi:DNA-binding NarL/FixJ family response regulator